MRAVDEKLTTVTLKLVLPRIGPLDRFWLQKLVSPDQFLFPKMVLSGPNLATKINPGADFRIWHSGPPDQFELLRMVQILGTRLCFLDLTAKKVE